MSQELHREEVVITDARIHNINGPGTCFEVILDVIRKRDDDCGKFECPSQVVVALPYDHKFRDSDFVGKRLILSIV